MVNEIKNWIKEGKKKGYSDEQLRGLLFKQGYSQSDINELFNKRIFDRSSIILVILIVITAVLGLFLYSLSGEDNQETQKQFELEEQRLEINDISSCDDLDTRGKDDCVFKIALKNKDKSLCEKMSTPEDKDECEFYVISSSEDKSVCEQFSSKEDKDYCQNYKSPF